MGFEVSQTDLGRLRALARGDETAMIRALQELVHFASINPPAEAGEVVGEATRQALAFLLDHARSLGLAAYNLDGLAGYVELGPADAAETVGVLAHVDVVPPGEGWLHAPFAGEIADGMIWGRGVEDDKGPAISALYAMKALAELGVPLARKVRLIAGTHEESGKWVCIERYRQSEPVPTLGFTPDANFPVICGEKGLMSVELRAEGGSDAVRGGLTIAGWWAGIAANVVPALAWAALRVEAGSRSEAHARVVARCKQYMATHELARLRVLTRGDFGAAFPGHDVPACDWVAAAEGSEAHAATPWDGHNAMLDLAGALAGLNLTADGPGRLARFIATRMGDTWDGQGLGVAAQHEKLGPTTVNLGVARGADGMASAVLNIRFTPPLSADIVAERLRQAGAAAGLDAILGPVSMDPLFVEESDPLISALKAAYAEVTGLPPACTYIGGTTYAKAFPRTVAFGPLLPDELMLAHQVDERVPVASIVRNAEIFAAALYRLTR